LLASGGFDRTVKLWDLATGKELFTMTGHNEPIISLVFTPDSKKLISGTVEDSSSTRTSLKMWDTATGKELTAIQDGGPAHQAPVLAATPDNKKVLVWDHSGSTGENQIQLYDLATGKMEQSLEESSRPVNSVAISADGELAAMGSNDGSVRIWQIAKKERLAGGDLPAHQEAIVDLSFTPDKKLLITAANDGQVRIWDISSRNLAKLEPKKTI